MDSTKWLLLPLFALAQAGLAQAFSGKDSLYELSLEELLSVEVSAASLTGSALSNAASWATVISEADWLKTGARTTFDALSFQPAVMTIPHVAGGEAVVMRGYTRTTSQRGVAILWDDVPLTDFSRGGPSINMPNINLFSLSSIELTQGAGSALHGSDAFHGVIGLRSFNPAVSQAAARLMAGSDGYYDAGIRHAGEFSGGHHVGFSLAANGQASQDLEYRATNPDTGLIINGERAMRYDTGTAAFHLASDKHQSTAYQLSYYIHRHEADGYPGAGPRLAQENDTGSETSDLQMGRFNLMQTVTDTGSLELRGYYWDLQNTLELNLGLFGGALPASQSLTYDQNRYGMQAIYRDSLTRLRTRWALAIGHDFLGIYNSRVHLATASGSVLQSGTDSLNGKSRNINNATFEADTALHPQRWNLVWGARLDDYSDFGEQVSPRVGLIFHPQPQHSIKLLYSEAFRAPTAAELYGASNLVQGNEDLNPETVRNHELLWLHLGSSSQTQISLFHSKWRDGIVTLTQPGTTLTRYQNQESNRSTGVTATHRVQFQPWLLDVGASWVESRNETKNVDYGAFPRYQFNLGVGYRAQPLRTDFYLSQHIMLDTDDIAEGTSDLEPTQLPTYWRTDLTATWQAAEHLDVQLVARNLFDRDNRVPAIVTNGGIPDERFSISAGARYRF